MLSNVPRSLFPRFLTAAISIWIALSAASMAQQPEEVPGLEDLDSIPASSGYRTSTCRVVFIDTLGVRTDSSLSSRSRYDEKGRIVEKIGYDGSDEELYRESWFYDTRTGIVLRARKQSSEDEEPASDWWYTHDTAGRLIHAEDSITRVAVDYRYGDRSSGKPCIAITVTGRFRFSGIDSDCDSLGRFTRQKGYIGQSDTVVAVHDYPAEGRHRRTVYTDNNQRVRQWIYLRDAAGHVVNEEYRVGTPEGTELLYTIDRIYTNGLLQREECRNEGEGDWVEYFEYR